MQPIIRVEGLSKTYAGGFQALKSVDLDIREGEIFALLGPNGAGKTTLINTICGLSRATSGTVTAGGHDIVADYRAARELIGLVPQEISTEAFEKVEDTVAFSRGLFGLPPSPALVTQILEELSLADKRKNKVMMLSGGMKRRLMIAKALAHEPKILFLDEPTAGVDVELRRGMWDMVARLRENGATIILTTHYIEEAEELADRIGIINKGEIVLVDDKASLMQKLGQKRLTLQLATPLEAVPAPLADEPITLEDEGRALVYAYDTRTEDSGVAGFLARAAAAGVTYNDLETEQSSLEDIFVTLVRGAS